MKLLAVSIAAVFILTTTQAADLSAVQITTVKRTNATVTGQPIVVPARPDVIVSIATFPPGARIAEHRHPYPHYVYVLEGVLSVVNTDTKESFDVKSGDFFAEMQDTWHYGINNGTVPVKLLAIDQVPTGTSSNTVPRKP